MTFDQILSISASSTPSRGFAASASQCLVCEEGDAAKHYGSVCCRYAFSCDKGIHHFYTSADAKVSFVELSVSIKSTNVHSEKNAIFAKVCFFVVVYLHGNTKLLSSVTPVLRMSLFPFKVNWPWWIQIISKYLYLSLNHSFTVYQ